MPEPDSQTQNSIMPAELITQRIFLIRGVKVMLDADLADLYEVSTKRLNEQVKRNKERFPNDFMFQLNAQEKDQVVAICDHLEHLKFSYQLPYAFTEHGVAMLSSVLKSKRAVEMNIIIVRVFIKLRELLSSSRELSYQIELLQNEQRDQNMHINKIYKLLEKFIDEPVKQKGSFGFDKPS